MCKRGFEKRVTPHSLHNCSACMLSCVRLLMTLETAGKLLNCSGPRGIVYQMWTVIGPLALLRALGVSAYIKMPSSQ